MTTPNAELAYMVLDHIAADPDSHMQDVWIGRTTCGTVACFAGWACLLSGDDPHYDEDELEAEEVWLADRDKKALNYVRDEAAHLLGIKRDGGPKTGYRLFEPQNDRETLRDLVAEIFGPRPAVTQ